MTGVEGEITVSSKEGKKLATAQSPGKAWREVNTTVQLDAGPQTLQLELEMKGQNISWIEFKPS